MEADGVGSGPDASSIRPVSSLRSHFETLSTSSAVPVGPPTSAREPRDLKTTNDTVQLGKPDTKPDMPQPWSQTPQASADNQKRRPPTPPKPRGSRTSSRLRNAETSVSSTRRASSHGPASPPQAQKSSLPTDSLEKSTRHRRTPSAPPQPPKARNQTTSTPPSCSTPDDGSTDESAPRGDTDYTRGTKDMIRAPSGGISNCNGPSPVPTVVHHSHQRGRDLLLEKMKPPPVPNSTKPTGISSGLRQEPVPLSVDQAPERPLLPPRPKTDINQGLHKETSGVQSGSASRNALSQGFSRVPKIVSQERNSQNVESSRVATAAKRSIVQSETSQVTSRTIQPAGRVERKPPTASTDNHLPERLSFPDVSMVNRRCPVFGSAAQVISCGYECRIMDTCGELVCAAGTVIRVWNLLSGKLLLNVPLPENIKITALTFKPARQIADEGTRIWLANNWGELLEVDVPSKRILGVEKAAHFRREVVRIIRVAANIWTLDDEGKLYVWPAGADGSPTLETSIPNGRLPRGHTASTVVDEALWLATGKEINVFRPSSVSDKPGIRLTSAPLVIKEGGDILCCTVVPSRKGEIYFGHSDGKISWFSTKDLTQLGVCQVSLSRMTCITGICDTLWVGLNSGAVQVYDVSRRPWTLSKEWRAHDGPTVRLMVDNSSIWKLDRMQVVSIGTDNFINIWDGMLDTEWQDDDVRAHETEFCKYREATALTLTWNAGAMRPADLNYRDPDKSFFQSLFRSTGSPDIIVVGLQELVDLEDKKVTAMTIFKGKTRDAYGQEQLGSVYRAWRDYFSRCIDSSADADDGYALLHTASLVGLFSCVFVKASQRGRIRQINSAEIKTGMGGLYGNKGALLIRMCFDDTSLCFVNSHLAAGQAQTLNRNEDVMTILEAGALPALRPLSAEYTCGGDGSMVLDHEICVFIGDLNYRIDAMSRQTVVDSINSRQYGKLLERDQLLLTKRRNPGFRLRAFREGAIDFAPTYKYDAGTDRYDSSEKRRVPAWCDRILYRGDKIELLRYQRHELLASDHRPVSASFALRVRQENAGQKTACRQRSAQRFEQMRAEVSSSAKLEYLQGMFGLSREEAEKLLHGAAPAPA